MKNCILIKKNYFFFKKDISLKWLHLVNELDCYKGVNVKLSRYFNAMASFCEFVNEVHKKKELIWVFRFFLFISAYKIFKKEVLWV